MSIQGSRTLLREYKGNTVEKHSSKKKYRFLRDTYEDDKIFFVRNSVKNTFPRSDPWFADFVPQTPFRPCMKPLTGEVAAPEV